MYISRIRAALWPFYGQSTIVFKTVINSSTKGLLNDCVLRVATNFHDTILKSKTTY